MVCAHNASSLFSTKGVSLRIAATHIPPLFASRKRNALSPSIFFSLELPFTIRIPEKQGAVKHKIGEIPLRPGGYAPRFLSTWRVSPLNSVGHDVLLTIRNR